MIWSWNTFRLDRIVENPGQRVLYLAPSGADPKRAFVREELMLVSEDTITEDLFLRKETKL